MSYEYLAKVGRDLLPLVEALRGVEVKVASQVNRHAHDPTLRREWEEALKKAETKLKQFATLRDRLDKQSGDDSAALLAGAKVPKINLPELDAEIAGLKERVGRHLTSLEHLSSVTQAIDKEKEHDEREKEKEKERAQREREAKERLEQAEMEHQRKVQEELEKAREEKEEEERRLLEQQQQQARQEKEIQERAAAAEAEAALAREQREDAKLKAQTSSPQHEEKREDEGQTVEKGKKETKGDHLLDLIDSINTEVAAGMLGEETTVISGSAKAVKARHAKERRPRERGEVPTLPAPVPKQPPQPDPQEMANQYGLPVIDDEMEELRMRLQRLEQGHALPSQSESEQEQAERSLQDDFERGLAQSGSVITSKRGQEGEASAEALGSTSSIDGDSDDDSTSSTGSGIPHQRQIPLDPVTPRTRKEFERPDKDEDDEGDDLPEEKAGEREIKYLTLKKKPIPKSRKKAEEEEEEQKITFHEGEPPAYHRGGYLKRLERKAIVKHKWQTRWMRLDSQYLSVYGSAAEASQDKSGKLALQQYRLYDLEEVALARNIHGMEIAFKLRFNDRQVLLSASTKNLMAKWMLAIDSVAHRRNYNETETAFISKLSQRDVCLRRLYLPVTEDGVISCHVDDKEYRWRYKRDENSPVGELVSDDGAYAFTWDAEYLRPTSDSSQNPGYGVWDGIWLTWYSADRRFVMRYQWHSAIEEFHYVSANPAIKTTFVEFPPFRYNGKVLLSRDRVFSWRVRGNKVPPPVVLSLQILYYHQNVKSK